VDTIPFVRRINRGHTERGLLLDVDTLRRSKSGTAYPRDADDVELLPGRHEMLLPWVVRGYQLFFVANLATDELAQAEAAMQRTAELLRLPVTEIVYCPHHSRPVACWCRMPLPGMGVYLMERHRLARKHLIVVGGGSDAEFARGIGATYWDARTCFGTQWA
jgi:histidinol phosphatase-like enzyme